MRLAAYDYAQPGAYFVTVCTQERLHLFGQIDDGRLAPNHLGRMVADCWFELPRHYPHVALDAFVVMPNHIHGLIVLRGYDEPAPSEFVTVLAPTAPADDSVGAGLRPAHPPQTTVRADPPGPAGLRPAPTSNDHDNAAFANEPIDDSVGAGLRPAPTPQTTARADPLGPAGLRSAANDDANSVVIKRHALPEIVRALKSFSTRRINESRCTPGAPVWQRNYYEHIVRTESELARVRIYIRDNPARWASDAYYSPAAARL